MDRKVMREHMVASKWQVRCLHDLVLEQCDRTPHRIAIRAQDGALTYCELASRVWSLARYLRNRGVGLETPVGVLLPRSRELPVALLGVLAAGGAYVPLDPNHPDARIASVLEDTQAPLVVTTTELAERVKGVSVGCVRIDTEAAAINTFPSKPLREISAPDRLAYLIYTSGSTGRPKGVMIEHRNVAALLEWACGEYSATELARVVASTSISFDLSVFEIFAPLVCGGSLDIIEDGLAFANWSERAQATLLNTVPSVMREMIAAEALPPRLAVINLAGESLSKDLVDAIWQQCPGCRIYNLYGPSEDTTFSTGDVVSPDDAKPTIGRPLTHRHFHLLDASGKLAPEGTVGEIYVGGLGVARGYWRRPELTVEAFLPDPILPGSARMYRTGDYGQLLPDGRLMFLGRDDDQVKLRGYRIDLGEIDAVLRTHPGIADVATVAVQDEHRGMLLRCALAVRDHASTDDIRDWLSCRLPTYMIPAEWITYEDLPKLSNGKTDRKTLRSIASAQRSDSTALPEGGTEIRLAALWSELLGRTQVHHDDTFIGLGGHSLLAARLSARIRTVFGLEISSARLMRAPTLRAQAMLIDSCTHSRKPPAIGIAPIEGRAPCSSSQRRMWALECLLPGCPRYNMPIAFTLRGAVDTATLEAALHLLVRRHPILRTTYQETDGELWQVAVAPATAILRHADVSHHERTKAHSEAIRIATDFASRCFDLAVDPPFAALLINLGSEERLFVLSTHHIAADGSVDLIISALSDAYNDVLVDPAPDATASILSYAAYATWERDRAVSQAIHSAALAFWKTRLKKPPPPLELPADRPPPISTTGRGGRFSCTLPEEIREGLLRLGHTHGTTLFQALLATSWAFLGRLCDQQDFCVAAPIADRPHPELQHVIGNFVNTVILRCDLSTDPSFDAILTQARERTIEAIEHGTIPFDHLVQAVPESRISDRMPFANVMVSLVQQEVGLSIAEAEANPVEIELPTTRFDLGFFFTTVDDEIQLAIEFNAERFEPSTVRRFAQHWITLASTALADPSIALSQLPLLSGAEREMILETWNATENTCDTGRLVHGLFEAQTRRQPQALAVRGSQFALTYSELDTRADRLAAEIAHLELQPSSRIAILCDRSPHLIVAMLAVLKAGCAYVPLDPDSPSARHAAMLRIANASALITDSSMQARAEELSLHATNDLPCLSADAADGHSRCGSVSSPAQVTPDDLAYVIFTSGTTGVPKGVAVRHRPVINLIDWVNTSQSVGPADQLLFVTSVAFDLSVYDVFGILAAGGTIRIASRDEVRDPRVLAEILEKEPITFWDSAPAALDQCLSYFSSTARPALRLAFLSGDWIPVTLPARLRSFVPGVEVIALGGATEAVVWSNFHRVEKVEPRRSSIPYGRPIQNARYHILDRKMQPVPIGVPGDLFIGGEVLADGYLGDPEQTAKRFVSDPFRATVGARLYHTGDRARYWEDGTIEFLGRVDTQVKIRGFRVEIGEIEALLATHPGVHASHVAVRGERAGRWLCAYVVAPAADAGLSMRLRAALRTNLPEYMVPADIVILDAFPLTANGKLDRDGLPDPRRIVADSSHNNTDMSEMEGLVTQIWRTSLENDDIGIDENFFDVGGNSVLLIHVHQAIEASIGLRVPIVELFRNPTIRSIVDRLTMLTPTATKANEAAGQRVSEGRQRLLAQRYRRNSGGSRANTQRTDKETG